MNAIQWDNLPDDILNSNSLLVYKLEEGPGDKPAKIPYDFRRNVKSNDPKLGATQSEIKAALANGGGYSGPGFFVESPFIVIDIDNCVSPEGDVAPYATEIVREINSYTELSPSLRGLHIWIRGTKPGTACRKGIEIYDHSRFMTLTAYHVPETPKQIREVDITSVYNRMLRGDFKESAKASDAVVSTAAVPSTQPAQIQSQGSGTGTTSKYAILMYGDILSTKPFLIGDSSGSLPYDSHSEADAALCVILAAKYDGDPNQFDKIDAEFRLSSLFREKWTREDYRKATIDSAIALLQKNKSAQNNLAAQSPSLVVDSDDEPIVEIEDVFPPFPQIPGSIGELCDAVCPDVPYIFKAFVAFTHFGLMRSGHDKIKDEEFIQPRLYAALISKPGKGKTAALNEIGRAMTPLSNEYQMFSSVDSGPKLVDDFNDQIRAGIIRADGGSPSLNPMAKILLSPDELRGLWEKAKVTQNSRNSLGDEILKLYEQNQTGSHVRMAKIKLDIKNAHLALIGGATEIGYASMFVGTQSSSDGLQSRIAPVAIKGEKMPSRQRPTDPEKFAAAIIRLSAQAKADDQLFPWNDEAFTLYDQWWNSKNSDNPNVERLDGIVKKLLIILVRTNDLSEITVPIAKVATEIGDYVLYCRDKYCSMDAAGFTQAFENKIAAAYLKHGSLSPHQCKRLVHPERYPGGFGHFIFAFNNLLKANELVEVGRNHKSKIYKIDRP